MIVYFVSSPSFSPLPYINKPTIISITLIPMNGTSLRQAHKSSFGQVVHSNSSVYMRYLSSLSNGIITALNSNADKIADSGDVSFIMFNASICGIAV